MFDAPSWQLTPAAGDINLNVLRIEGYRFFCNKLWNATKFALMRVGEFAPVPLAPSTPVRLFDRSFFSCLRRSLTPQGLSTADRWIMSALTRTVAAVNSHFEKFEFGLATQSIYSFWLYDLCDVYLVDTPPPCLR
jgi:valyl-tRNA synthetase